MDTSIDYEPEFIETKIEELDKLVTKAIGNGEHSKNCIIALKSFYHEDLYKLLQQVNSSKNTASLEVKKALEEKLSAIDAKRISYLQKWGEAPRPKGQQYG